MPARNASGGAPYTICIAERNPRIRAFLIKEFAGRGYEVVAAGSGSELIAAAAAAPRPDLFVIDPETPGLESSLAGRGGGTLRPMILHALLPDSEGHPLVALADAVIEKDADPSVLAKAVEQLLRTRRTGEER